MSLKENVNFVKKELDSQEKFLESFVKVERFYKKNRKLLLFIAVIIVVALVGFATKNYVDEKNKTQSNLAFTKFLNDNTDEKALEELKQTNSRLYNVALFIKSKQAPIDQSINNRYLNSLVAYKKALETSSIDELNTLSMQKDFLLKEFALFNKALLLTEEENFVEAKKTLQLIKKDSQVADLVALLNHYLLTK